MEKNKKIQNKLSIQIAKKVLGTILVTIFIFGFSLPIVEQVHAASWGGAWDSVKDWAKSGDDPNNVVSFSDFKGGLNAPTKDGLDSSLTQTDNARQFIINAVNFVLGFLGLAAVIVIVYAGILYVSSAGNDENLGKAKNAIKYAVIGIILIAGSYAFVNTIIKFAATGQSDRTAAPNSNVAIQGAAGAATTQGGIYSLGAAEIQSAMNAIENAYKTIVNIQGIFIKIDQIEPPTTTDPIKLRSEYRTILGQISNWINEIKNNTDTFSETHIASQKLLNEYLSKYISMSDDGLDAAIKNGEISKDNIVKHVKDSFTNDSSQNHPINDFKKTLSDLVGPLETIDSNIKQPTAADDRKGRLSIVWKIIGPSASDSTANSPKFTNQVDPQEIQKAFAGIDPTVTVGGLFVESFTNIKTLSEVSIDEANSADNTKKFVNTMQSLNRLLIVVKNIKFVSADIKANITSGNAPLIVELNGLGSRDPRGATIPDENYFWDPDGDGTPGVQDANLVTCNNAESKGAVLSCTYTQPGTYIVRLNVKGAEDSQVSDGFATIAITVKPSLAKIILTAKTSSDNEAKVLHRDEIGSGDSNDSSQKSAAPKKAGTINESEYHITTDEGTRAVTFSAEGTKDSYGNDISDFLWKYGDGAPDSHGANPEPHRYKKGRYPLILEVTDKAGRKDRVVITVFVSSLAARINPDKTVAAKDELIEFDGSSSHSDTGTIISYAWKIYADNTRNNAGNDATANDDQCANGEITDKTACRDIVSEDGSPRLQVKFKNPGVYKVELSVTDPSTTETSHISIQIKSQKPRGVINMRACPENCPVPSDPSIIDFDSAGSFDPDVDDTLNYKWEVYNSVGDKLPLTESTFQQLPVTASQAATQLSMEGDAVKLLRLKFARVGKYKMVLRVNDSYANPLIRQESVIEKFFDVKSTIGVEWAAAMKSVAQLSDNRATITFAGTIHNADSADIDFGDGESKDLTVTNANAPFSEAHVYDKAKEYIVTLHAASATNGENSITKRIVIAAGNEPRAVIRVLQNDTEVVLPEDANSNAAHALEINRGVRLTFDARQSIAADGSQNPSKLNYAWEFGDGETSTKDSVTHTYRDLTADDATTLVKLTVSQKDDASKKNTQQFPIRIISSKPTLTALTLEKRSSGNETPVSVLLRAEGATDSDGRITNYQFWYYHPDNPEERFSVLDTSSNQAELTVETYGDAGKENEFIFCVSLTDSDNSTAECNDLIDENRRPHLLVKNGPNKAPTASFDVQPSTTVRVGEEVTFTSSSSDDDGQISKYIWDVEGDGFQNNNPTDSPTITHTYTKKSPAAGYKVKLKVIDDKNAAGYSREIPVIVTTPSNAPRANFRYEADPNIPLRMKFFDASTPDQQHQAQIKEWKWDFDLSQEFGCSNDNKPAYCNGDKTDDIDSTDQFPVFDFPTTGRYQVKMTVTDNFDSDAEIVQFVDVRGGSNGATDSGVSRPRGQSAQADLKAYYDNRFANFETSQKVLHIPANACAADVSFYWGDSRANDVPLFKLDKNIYNDANGDGNRSNDYQDVGINNECLLNGTRKNNCTVLSFQRFDQQTSPRGSGQFETEVSMLTQPQAGASSTIIDKDSVKIVFDKTNNPATELTQAQCSQRANNLSGSLFNVDISQNTLLYILGGSALALLGYLGISRFGKHSQPESMGK